MIYMFFVLIFLKLLGKLEKMSAKEQIFLKFNS